MLVIILQMLGAYLNLVSLYFIKKKVIFLSLFLIFSNDFIENLRKHKIQAQMH